MALSRQQTRLIGLMRAGGRLQIVRSIFNQRPVHGLLLQDGPASIEEISWWRIEKMIRKGVVEFDTGNVETATHVCAV